jgi:hypothetical protein
LSQIFCAPHLSNSPLVVPPLMDRRSGLEIAFNQRTWFQLFVRNIKWR